MVISLSRKEPNFKVQVVDRHPQLMIADFINFQIDMRINDWKQTLTLQIIDAPDRHKGYWHLID